MSLASFSEKGEYMEPLEVLDMQLMRVVERAERAGARVGLLVSHLSPEDNGKVVTSHQPDRLVDAASINKLAVACALVASTEGKHEPSLPDLEISAVDHPAGGGKYDALASNEKVSVSDAVVDMLDRSGNMATGALMRAPFLGGPEGINAILDGLGFTATRLVPQKDGNGYYLGQTTAAEAQQLLLYLTAMARRSPLGSAIESALYAAHGIVGSGGVVASLPHDMIIAAKTGEWNGGDEDMPYALRYLAMIVVGPGARQDMAVSFVCEARRKGVAEVARRRLLAEILEYHGAEGVHRVGGLLAGVAARLMRVSARS